MALQFGLWLPVYGGWLRAEGFDVEPSVEACFATADIAEQFGYSTLYASENFLNCIHGPQHDVCDAWSTLAAVATRTQAVQLVGAIKPGFRSPLVAAQMIATVDRLSRGRVAVNVVCGWWRNEFEACGVDWLSHDEKYEHASEYFRSMRALWSGERGSTRRALCGRECPAIWIGGHSDAALGFAAAHADVLFLNGMHPEAIVALRARLNDATPVGRQPLIAMNAFVVLGDDDAAAERRRDQFIERGRADLIELFRAAQIDAGTSGWSGLSDSQMVDANDGLSAGLVGSVETVTHRLFEFERAGVDLVICQFADALAESRRFGSQIVPRFRRWEARPAIANGGVK